MKTRSLLLDNNWDLSLDSQGFLATTAQPYAVAQDVACACLTVQGEAIFDTTIGSPYFEKILGTPAPIGLLSSYLKEQAERLSTVRQATVTLTTNRTTRIASGYIEIIDTNSTLTTIGV